MRQKNTWVTKAVSGLMLKHEHVGVTDTHTHKKKFCGIHPVFGEKKAKRGVQKENTGNQVPEKRFAGSDLVVELDLEEVLGLDLGDVVDDVLVVEEVRSQLLVRLELGGLDALADRHLGAVQVGHFVRV
jgi:hypothetical protein